MNKHKIRICIVLLFVTAGFAFGADLYSEGSVSVVFPPSSGAAGLSVADAELQGALQTADKILLPAGFVRSQMSPPNASGLIGVFSRDASVGSPTACDIFVRNNRLVFSFIESGIRNSGPATVQLCNELADALRARFGAAAVEVQLK